VRRILTARFTGVVLSECDCSCTPRTMAGEHHTPKYTTLYHACRVCRVCRVCYLFGEGIGGTLWSSDVVAARHGHVDVLRTLPHVETLQSRV